MKKSTPFDSPALHQQYSDYPMAWQGRVPKRVRMIKTVRCCAPRAHWIGGAPKKRVAISGTLFDVWVGPGGEVLALYESGEALVLDMGTFVVFEWHEGKGEPVNG